MGLFQLLTSMDQEELNAIFITAAKVGDLDTVKDLLQFGADIHANNDSALRLAARNGQTEMVQELLQPTCGFIQGADIHAMNDGALKYAAENGHTETVQALLLRGANVHAEDYCALRYAAGNGHAKTLRVLLQACSTVLLQACSTRGFSKLNILNHMLCEAARKGHTEIVQELIKSGANSDVVSFSDLKKFLTLIFILSIPNEIIAGIEASHPETKKYRWLEKKTFLEIPLKPVKEDNILDVRISLADLYYRPGETGYLQVIS